MEKFLWEHIKQVREQAPLIHNITNYVVMNNTANALLAIGASPIMAHAVSEIDEMVAICQSLVINIGTLDEAWVDAMLRAANKANQLGKPFVLDPVGAGATAFRDRSLAQLIELRPTVIRGNASEIMALAQFNKRKTKGVDSTAQSSEATEAARYLNQQYGSLVCISGETDIVISHNQEIHIKNGHPMMTKVTGLGCSATAIIGAFIAVTKNQLEGLVAASALLSIAGEIAARTAQGPGSLQMQILDKLYNITADEFYQYLQVVISD